MLTQPYPSVYNFLKKLPWDEILSYDAIGSISGDGCSHEIINAFFSRTDIDFSKHKLTIFQIPAGSACALLENSLKLIGKK